MKPSQETDHLKRMARNLIPTLLLACCMAMLTSPALADEPASYKNYGNPAALMGRGRKLFQELGCVSCHSP